MYNQICSETVNMQALGCLLSDQERSDAYEAHTLTVN